MSKEGRFLIFCIEQYKVAKRLTGKQVMEIFRKYMISEYIVNCFEALHTTGTNYIVEDIDLYIESRRQVYKNTLKLNNQTLSYNTNLLTKN